MSKRTLPHSKEAEQSLLGAMIKDPERVVPEAIEAIENPESFYLDKHRIIFRIMKQMFYDGQEIDEVTLVQELGEDNLEQIGGEKYLAEIAVNVPSVENAREYADVIKDKHARRELIRFCSDVGEDARNMDGDTDELLERAEEELFRIREGQMRDELLPSRDVMSDVLTDIEAAAEHEGDVIGTPVGLPEFDEMTGGLKEEQLIILAARPGMGKTSLALNMIEHIGVEERLPAAIFSLEMGKVQLLKRIIASRSEVDFGRLDNGTMRDDEWTRVKETMDLLEDAPIYLDDTPVLDVLTAKAKARRLASKIDQDLGVLVIDYLQLMQSHERTDSREQEIAGISRGLKRLAMELEIPVLILAQLNRQLEQRQDKRPQLADLRGSGAIEQDADIVTFLYREYEYSEKEEDLGQAEFIVAKHRNGPSGTIDLTWVPENMRFKPRARPSQESQEEQEDVEPVPEEEPLDF